MFNACTNRCGPLNVAIVSSLLLHRSISSSEFFHFTILERPFDNLGTTKREGNHQSCSCLYCLHLMLSTSWKSWKLRFSCIRLRLCRVGIQRWAQRRSGFICSNLLHTVSVFGLRADEGSEMSLYGHIRHPTLTQ